MYYICIISYVSYMYHMYFTCLISYVSYMFHAYYIICMIFLSYYMYPIIRIISNLSYIYMYHMYHVHIIYVYMKRCFNYNICFMCSFFPFFPIKRFWCIALSWDLYALPVDNKLEISSFPSCSHIRFFYISIC